MARLEMTPARVAAGASLALALLVESGTIKGSPEFVAALIILAAVWLYVDTLRATLDNHQKALRWFADHVYEADKDQHGGDAPQELRDLVKHD